MSEFKERDVRHDERRSQRLFVSVFVAGTWRSEMAGYWDRLSSNDTRHKAKLSQGRVYRGLRLPARLPETPHRGAATEKYYRGKSW
jgi:hypothetical protein